MILRIITTGFFVLLGVVCGLAPIDVSAKSAGSNASAHAPFHSSANWRHRRPYRYYPYGYSYYPPDPYGEPNDTAPPPPKPVTDSRRGCEPQTYSVPSSSGGESQVTVLRC